MGVGNYELVDRRGRRLNLCTTSDCVVMQSGGVLADYEPLQLLATIRHSLAQYPLVLLLHKCKSGTALTVPARIEHKDTNELSIYIPHIDWGEKPEVKKISDREYTVSFERNPYDSLYIRLF